MLVSVSDLPLHLYNRRSVCIHLLCLNVSNWSSLNITHL